MPAFNEEAAIANSVRSLLAVDYPEELLELVVVNDGSTDGTSAEIASVAAAEPRVRVIDFPENRGKRAAMAAGIRATSAEVVAFVDSDSELDPKAVHNLVQGFADERVGAIAGHADVLNSRESWIARMQAVRYFVAFRVCKAAESVFGAVTCCSGCFSAYRRSAILPWLDHWENQTFLGQPATYGDDRSLTNYVLRDWSVTLRVAAISRTIVPAHFRLFLRQQLRWKRSWTRESLIVVAVHLAQAPARVRVDLPGHRAAADRPGRRAAGDRLACRSAGGVGLPLIYLSGIYAMALVYGLYYGLRGGHQDTLWIFGVVFIFFYLAFLLWQTYYAILTARNPSWGTQVRTAGNGGGVVVKRAGRMARNAMTFLLLPLSLLPLYLAVPKLTGDENIPVDRPAARRAPARDPARAAGEVAPAAGDPRCRQSRCWPTTGSTTARTTTRSRSVPSPSRWRCSSAPASRRSASSSTCASWTATRRVCPSGRS